MLSIIDILAPVSIETGRAPKRRQLQMVWSWHAKLLLIHAELQLQGITDRGGFERKRGS